MGIDRNAADKVRLRRNQQRTVKGDAFAAIPVVAPLVNTRGTLSLASGQSVIVSSGKLEVQPATTALTVGPSGLSFVVSDTSLTQGVGGAKINLADTSLAVSAGLKVNLAANPGLTVSSGLLLKLTDTSLVLSTNGVAVNLAANPGLQVSSGLLLKLADNSLTLSSSGVAVKLNTGAATGNNNGGGMAVTATGLVVAGFQEASSNPARSAGSSWYNQSLGQNVLAAYTDGTNQLNAASVASFFAGANSSVITNTTALTVFTPTVTMPASSLNLLGRVIRITAIVNLNLGGGGNFTFSLVSGATSVWSQTLSASQNNLWVEILLTVTLAGSSGSVLTVGKTFSGSQAYTASNFATSSVNLTVARSLQFDGQFSVASASNSVQVSIWNMELLA